MKPFPMQPLVSIVIPTKNSASTLDGCLKSIQNQTYSNIELIVVDSRSVDNTVDIARKYSTKIIETEWKLLGARYLGFKASKGCYVLYLDSDQILAHPHILEYSLCSFSNYDYDMLCLEEESYNPHSFLQKLIAADRKLVNSIWDRNIDPLKGVLIPRFYKYCILDAAFKKLDILGRMHDIAINEDCLIYYHAFSTSSSKVGVISRALMHKDPSSIVEYFQKNYSYGKNMRLLVKSDVHKELIIRNIRFRKGLSLNMQSVQSIILRMLKVVPFLVGAITGRMML